MANVDLSVERKDVRRTLKETSQALIHEIHQENDFSFFVQVGSEVLDDVWVPETAQALTLVHKPLMRGPLPSLLKDSVDYLGSTDLNIVTPSLVHRAIRSPSKLVLEIHRAEFLWLYALRWIVIVCMLSK